MDVPSSSVFDLKSNSCNGSRCLVSFGSFKIYKVWGEVTVYQIQDCQNSISVHLCKIKGDKEKSLGRKYKKQNKIDCDKKVKLHIKDYIAKYLSKVDGSLLK